MREMPTSIALLRVALTPPTVGSLSLIQSFANELPESTWADIVRRFSFLNRTSLSQFSHYMNGAFRYCPRCEHTSIVWVWAVSVANDSNRK